MLLIYIYIFNAQFRLESSVGSHLKKRSAVVLGRFVNLSHTHQFLKIDDLSVDF